MKGLEMFLQTFDEVSGFNPVVYFPFDIDYNEYLTSNPPSYNLVNEIDTNIKKVGLASVYTSAGFVHGLAYSGLNDNFGDGISDLPFSICSWVRTESNLRTQTIYSKRENVSDKQEYLFFYFGDGIMVRIYSQSSASDYLESYYEIILTNNEWYHVAFTYDGLGNPPDIYINGLKLQTVKSVVGNYVAMSNTGSQSSPNRGMFAGNTSWTGWVDECFVNSGFLTEAEILNIYNLGLNGTPIL